MITACVFSCIMIISMYLVPVPPNMYNLLLGNIKKFLGLLVRSGKKLIYSICLRIRRSTICPCVLFIQQQQYYDLVTFPLSIPTNCKVNCPQERHCWKQNAVYPSSLPHVTVYPLLVTPSYECFRRESCLLRCRSI